MYVVYHISDICDLCRNERRATHNSYLLPYVVVGGGGGGGGGGGRQKLDF